MAALLGGLPLALGRGVGSELRRPLGIAIVGGLLLSQLLTLYTTPVMFLYLDRLRLWLREKGEEDFLRPPKTAGKDVLSRWAPMWAVPGVAGAGGGRPSSETGRRR